LIGKNEALSSNPSTAKKKKKERERKLQSVTIEKIKQKFLDILCKHEEI
jgi:hypothetical protein